VQVESRKTRAAIGERVPCRYAFEMGAINWRGEVIACSLDMRAEFIAGRISVETIADAWNGKHHTLRDLHEMRQFGDLPAPCAKCQYWDE